MTGRSITKGELFERMRSSISTRTSGRPPFTLVLGSGFSFPIIPTTSEIVRVDMPWWKSCQAQRPGGPKPTDYLNRNEKSFADTEKEYARAFWESVRRSAVSAFSPGKPPFALDVEGLPEKNTIGEAYRFALSPRCGPGLSSPDEVRRYFADLVRRIGRRLNPAHLYLAAIIAERPDLFGTLFTTNFDPLLQRALQFVNLPYFVSDRPETLQHPDDDAAAEAIHLVYAHGSIYRYLLLNSQDQIEEFAKRNQSLLQEYFRKHAVIIVGYSGWDDAITRALLKVEQFAHNLYWCDRGTDLESSGLSPLAKELFRKHDNAFYVPIENADRLMAEMHQHLLGHALPRMFRSPLEDLQNQLKQCDLTSVSISRKVEVGDNHISQAADASDKLSSDVSGTVDDFNLGSEVAIILKRLEDAQRLFTGGSENRGVADDRALRAARLRERMAIAADLYFGSNPVSALPHLDKILEDPDALDVEEVALARFRRGFLFGRRAAEGDLAKSIGEYTAVIQMHGVSDDRRVRAYVNRGGTYHLRRAPGDLELAIKDFSSAIAIKDAPVDQLGGAYLNRAISYLDRKHEGDLEAARADLGTAIDLPGIPPTLRAKALFNRGVMVGGPDSSGSSADAISDLSTVVEMKDADATVRARALVNRGTLRARSKRPEDLSLAILDYTVALSVSGVSESDKASARLKRADAYANRATADDLDLAVSDYLFVSRRAGANADIRAAARRELRELRKRLPKNK